MKNNKLGLKVMAALLAVAIVGSFAITTKSNNLRAMEGDEGFVEEAPAEVVQEVFVEPEPEIIPEEPAEEVPVEEPAEEAPEEPAAEEPAEEAEAEAEEELFDVVAAYEHYMSLDEYGKIEYLNSLSDANREELKRYIEMKEAEAKAAEEPKEEEKQEEPAEEPEEPEKVEEDYTFDVNIWYETEGKLTYGATVVWKSSVSGVKDGDAVSYQWQVDKGNGWEDIPGATDPEYVMTLSKENAKYNWRLIANAK